VCCAQKLFLYSPMSNVPSLPMITSRLIDKLDSNIGPGQYPVVSPSQKDICHVDGKKTKNPIRRTRLLRRWRMPFRSLDRATHGTVVLAPLETDRHRRH
jgi:hypothetical protein